MHCRGGTNRAAECGAIEVLLTCMEWTDRSLHCDAMRRAAIAGLGLMFRTVDLLASLAEARAPDRLQKLISNPEWRVVSRKSALLALEVWNRYVTVTGPLQDRYRTVTVSLLALVVWDRHKIGRAHV